MSVSKTDLLVGAAKTEANQVLGSRITISTRRRDPRTSKETKLKSNGVLAKFGLNEGEEESLNLLLLLGSSQGQERENTPPSQTKEIMVSMINH